MRKRVSIARSLGRHTAIYGAGVLLQRIAGLLMLPLYTRRLERADYGLISIIDATVALVALVVGLNLAEALIRIYNERDDDEWRRTSVGTTVLANGVLAALGALLLSLGAAAVGPLIFGCPVPQHLVLLAATTMALDALATPCFTYLRLLDRSGTFVLVSLGRLVLAVSINLVWLGWLRGGVTAYFASNAIASAAQGTFLLAWTFRRVSPRPSREVLGHLLRFALPLVPASLCALVLHRSQTWVLARFGATAALGVFGVAYQLGNVVSNGLVQPFTLVWGTKVYEVVKREDGRAVVARVFLWFALIVTWGAAGLSLLAKPLLFGLGFVGPGFLDAVGAVPFVAFSYVIFGLGCLVHMGILIAKKTERSFDAAFRAAVASIVLNVVGVALAPDELLHLVPGATGLVSFGVLAALRYRYAQELYPFPYDVKRAATLVLLGGAFVFAAEAARLEGSLDAALRTALALGFAPAAFLILPATERVLVLRNARRQGALAPCLPVSVQKR